MDPDKLDLINEAARHEGPTIRRVNEDGGVSVMHEETQDPSGVKAAAKSALIRAAEQDALDADEAEGDLAELEAEEAQAEADAAADAEASGEDAPLDLGGDDNDEPIDLDNMGSDPYEGLY